MRARSVLLDALGGEEGCRQLSAAFYARVGTDPVLRPFFPGKSLKCAIAEFAAFLIQFLGGDEEQTQSRWWLSLRESHARFQIGPSARRAWLHQMEATLDAAPIDEATRNALRHFFSRSSAYVIGSETTESNHEELAARWSQQRVLDSVITAIVEGRDDETLALVPRFASRPSVFLGLLARMVQSGRPRLIHFVIDAAESHPPSRNSALPETLFCISRPAPVASRWLHYYCGWVWTRTSRAAANIPRSIASPTNAWRKQPPRSSVRCCEPVPT